MDELRLHLDGPALGIDARALRDGLASLLKLVTSVEDGAENSAPEVWVLSDLSIASVDCAVTAVPGFEVGGRARFETVWSGRSSWLHRPAFLMGGRTRRCKPSWSWWTWRSSGASKVPSSVEMATHQSILTPGSRRTLNEASARHGSPSARCEVRSSATSTTGSGAR